MMKCKPFVSIATSIIVLLSADFSDAANNCINIIEVSRDKGSSVASSCSYSEPNRISIKIKFRNQCESKIHAHFEFQMDQGEPKKTTEYSVGPGKTRSTIGVCGAGEWVYWQE
jgi:DNA-directed RNA polymerase subunit M/transcription elongation factor TFIIS